MECDLSVVSAKLHIFYCILEKEGLEIAQFRAPHFTDVEGPWSAFAAAVLGGSLQSLCVALR